MSKKVRSKSLQSVNKKLNLDKNAFIESFKGKRLVWLSNDENYLKFAKEHPSLADLDYVRYKKVVVNKKLYSDDLLDLDENEMDKLEIAKFAKIYFLNKHLDLEFIDFSSNYTELEKDRIIEVTNFALSKKDNFVIFNGIIKYNDFESRIPIIVKKNQKTIFYELSTLPYPTTINALEMAFHYMNLNGNKFQVSHSNFRILTVNKSCQFNSFENSEINSLFTEWDEYYSVKTPNIYKITTSLDGTLLPSANSNDLEFFLDTFAKKNDYDKILAKIRLIQSLEEMPYEKLQSSYQDLEDSPYMPVLLEIEGVPAVGSVFDFIGDLGFSFQRKIDLWYKGYKFMDEVPDLDLVNEQKLTLDEAKKLNDFKTREDLAYKKGFKRIIQKDSFHSKEPFEREANIVNFLTKFKAPIYYVDIKTVKFAIPKVKHTQPFEHIPFEFSIHVVLDNYDYDLDNKRKVFHYQWIADKKSSIYKDFWINFIEKIKKHGDGTIVFYNSFFDNYLLRKVKAKPDELISKELKEEISNLIPQSIDLIKLFTQKVYYDSSFGTKHNLRTVVKHFNKKIDFAKLLRIRTAKEASYRARVWLVTDRLNNMWNDIRTDLMQFCKQESLAMAYLVKYLKERYEF